MRLLSIALLLTLASCAGQNTHTVVRGIASNSYHSESMLRYSYQKLGEIIDLKRTSSILAHCHKGSYSSGKKAAQERYYSDLKKKEYWNNLGTCYFLKENLQKSTLYFQKSLLISKNNPVAYNNLGLIALKLGDYTEAILYLKKAIKKSSHYITPKINLALIYLEHLDTENSDKIINQLRAYENDSEIIAMRAISATIKGNYQGSIALFSKLNQEYKRREDISYFNAYSHYMIDQDTAAKDILGAMKPTGIQSYKNKKFKLMALINKRIKEKKKRGSHEAALL